jgi:predicted esterase
MRRFFPLLFALLALGPLGALAAPKPLRDVPCQGCLLQLPAGESREPTPLLVLLHGDEGNPSTVFPRWSRAAEARGYALLALQCPRALGCTQGSWWRWDGDPAWISAQVAAVAERTPLDRRRIFLSGWSGGASYLARVALQLQGFTGLHLHGGGLAPRGEVCPRCPLPTYFLVGDRNPLHELAVEARDGIARCGGALEWSLLPGKDHAGELAALDSKRASVILQWLELHAHRLRCDELPSAPSAEPPPVEPPAPSAEPPAPIARPPRARGCGCDAVGKGAQDSWATAALGLVGWAWRRRGKRWRKARKSPICSRSPGR